MMLESVKGISQGGSAAVAFKNRRLAKKVAKNPCAWCGWIAGRRHAAHIIDEGPDAEWNAISLCPNCATVFDEMVRPKFYRALKEFGCRKLPASWRKDNKISESIDAKL